MILFSFSSYWFLFARTLCREGVECERRQDKRDTKDSPQTYNGSANGIAVYSAALTDYDRSQ